MEQPFFLIIDPDNNMSEGDTATEAWDTYTSDHAVYILSDCRVLECLEKKVKVKLEFL